MVGMAEDRSSRKNSQAGAVGNTVVANLPDGFEARHLAVSLLQAVLRDGKPFDEALGNSYTAVRYRTMAARDRALARAIAAATLRRAGQLAAVIQSFLDKPLPDNKGALMPILASAAAQLLILKSAPHAVINIAVEQCRHDTGARRFDRLANAVLRRVAKDGAELFSATPVASNFPPWLWRRWVAAFGEAETVAIAEASLTEAALDLTPARDPEAVAALVGGTLLATGSVRLSRAEGRIEDLPGYGDGLWWVQDAAAALPVQLLGAVGERDILDVCAAPGGKTAQLAARGARVTALDVSAKRLGRLTANLARLNLTAHVVQGDAATWTAEERFDGIVLDVPCTATGTLRRHPDIAHLKREDDVARLAALQTRLVDNAVGQLKPGGILVYCCCSLEPEEGPDQIGSLLARDGRVRRLAVTAGEAGIAPEWITGTGDVRTLPFHTPAPMVAQDGAIAPGMDGFYMARLQRV